MMNEPNKGKSPIMQSPEHVTMPADELSAILKNAHQDKQDHSGSCFFQMLTILGGFLLLSLSIAVWVNWIL